jgi:carbon storage regulator
MLVLGRNVDQEIRIGESIVVRVLEIRQGRVRLGFEAPPHVAIHRAEVWARIQAERDAGDGATANE